MQQCGPRDAAERRPAQRVAGTLARHPVLRHPERDYVRMSVSDTGHGIAKEILPQIFEPYYTTKSLAKAAGWVLPSSARSSRLTLARSA